MIDFRRLVIPFVVALTGACVLVIEVVATRILSPYYGNTIFTYSSVLGMVLAALSFGYYFGGRWADRKPSEGLFYGIIASSGLSVFVLHGLTLTLLPSVGYSFSMRSGPVVFSIILFFVPGLILGTLSPFGIKLQEKRFPNVGIGSLTGEIFFWSTLGSIAGSLLTGFYFIPSFGLDKIMIGVAITLLLLGIIPLLRMGIKKKIIINFLVLALLGLGTVLTLLVKQSSSSLFERDGIYEKIIVYDSGMNGRPVRIFKQDHSISGAMYLDGDDLVAQYTKYYRLYKLFNTEIKEALVIGGGAYSVPRALILESPTVHVDVSEIEPSLFELSKKYFKLPDSNRITNSFDDGRRFLRDSTKKYDLIFSDVYYSFFSIPSHFITKEFFEVAKARLSQNGVFVGNLIGDISRQKPSLLLSEIRTFKSVFPNSQFFAVESPGKSSAQNVMFVGYNSEQPVNLNADSILKHEDSLIRGLHKQEISLDRFDVDAELILNDNYAPVEHLTLKVLERRMKSSSQPNGAEMMALIEQQLSYGPRNLSSKTREGYQKFILAELSALGFKTDIQTWDHVGRDGQLYKPKNIIGRFNLDASERIILGTHYDTRKYADRGKAGLGEPVPGANDGASGVAVLLEIARLLYNSGSSIKVGVDIVFFDGEEGEELKVMTLMNWSPLGSNYFADHIREVYPQSLPKLGMVLDMVCDKDLVIRKEPSSVSYANTQVTEFWKIAESRYPDSFKSDKDGPLIRDDHDALNRVGIPTFLLIDFEYPYFHSIDDTSDKCSGASLEKVANSIWAYMETL